MYEEVLLNITLTPPNLAYISEFESNTDHIKHCLELLEPREKCDREVDLFLCRALYKLVYKIKTKIIPEDAIQLCLNCFDISNKNYKLSLAARHFLHLAAGRLCAYQYANIFDQLITQFEQNQKQTIILFESIIEAFCEPESQFLTDAKHKFITENMVDILNMVVEQKISKLWYLVLTLYEADQVKNDLIDYELQDPESYSISISMYKQNPNQDGIKLVHKLFQLVPKSTNREYQIEIVTKYVEFIHDIFVSNLGFSDQIILLEIFKLVTNVSKKLLGCSAQMIIQMFDAISTFSLDYLSKKKSIDSDSIDILCLMNLWETAVKEKLSVSEDAVGTRLKELIQPIIHIYINLYLSNNLNPSDCRIFADPISSLFIYFPGIAKTLLENKEHVVPYLQLVSKIILEMPTGMISLFDEKMEIFLSTTEYFECNDDPWAADGVLEVLNSLFQSELSRANRINDLFEALNIDSISPLIQPIFNFFAHYSDHQIVSKAISCLKKIHQLPEDLIDFISNNINQETFAFLSETESHSHIEFFEYIFSIINTDCLFSHFNNILGQTLTEDSFACLCFQLRGVFKAIKNAKQYQIVFDWFISTAVETVVNYSLQFGSCIIPSLKLWQQIVDDNVPCRIQISKVSPSGIILLKMASAQLCPMTESLIANESNDYEIFLRPLKLIVDIIGKILNANYIMFKAFSKYGDESLSRLVSSLTSAVDFLRDYVEIYPKILKTTLNSLGVSFESHFDLINGNETFLETSFEVLKNGLSLENKNIHNACLKLFYTIVQSPLGSMEGSPLCCDQFAEVVELYFNIMTRKSSLNVNDTKSLIILTHLNEAFIDQYIECSRSISNKEGNFDQISYEFKKKLMTMNESSSIIENKKIIEKFISSIQ